jgi:hypothetical protein
MWMTVNEWYAIASSEERLFDAKAQTLAVAAWAFDIVRLLFLGMVEALHRWSAWVSAAHYLCSIRSYKMAML